jgi:HK97 family phage portal protein
MGIFDAFRGKGLVAAAAADREIDVTRPLESFPDGINPVLFEHLDGLTSFDQYLTKTLAMKVPAVRRAVRVLADAVASMPLTAWRGLQPVPTSSFLRQPEDWRPLAATLRETVTDLIFHSEAWWKVQARDFTGHPLVAVRLDPAYVTVTRVPGSSEIERIYATYKGYPVEPADLMRFDGPDEGVLKLGTVEIWTALRLELAAQTYADPEVPSGYLTNTGEYRLTPDERTAILAEWRAARRRGSTAFFDANLSYEFIQAMPDQLQLVQGREESAAQIARLMNIPPHYVGAKSGSSMTYSTVAAQRRDLVDLSLAPYIQAIDGRLSMSDRNGSPLGQTVRLDRSDLLRSDAREDAEIGEILIRSGQSTVNEQRARRGLPPLSTPAPASTAPDAGAGATTEEENADAQAA